MWNGAKPKQPSGCGQRRRCPTCGTSIPPHVLIKDTERGSPPPWRGTSGPADVRRPMAPRRLPNPCVRREELGMALAAIPSIQIQVADKILSSSVNGQRPWNKQQGGQRHYHDQSRFRWTAPHYNNNSARQQQQQNRFRWTAPHYNNNSARQQQQQNRFRWTAPHNDNNAPRQQVRDNRLGGTPPRHVNPPAHRQQQPRPARPQEPPRLFFYRPPLPQRRTVFLARANFGPEENQQVQGRLQKNKNQRPTTRK